MAERHNSTIDLLGRVSDEQRVWASADSLDFFRRERSSPDDLYPSEKIFLPEVAGRVANILDIGCACGGFATIMKSFNPEITYTGIDIIPEMLARAVRAHKGDRFACAAGHALPFSERSFEMVHCSGSLHLNSRYDRIIAEIWRVAGRYALFDMRLTEAAGCTGKFNVDFSAGSAKKGNAGTLPYHVVNLNKARDLIDSLEHPPARVRLAGYRHPASDNAELPGKSDVIMAFLLLERGEDRRGWEIKIESSP